MRRRIDWSKWALGIYFLLFLVFLYAPMILMAILSFQGPFGQLTFPFKGPFSLEWWRSLYDVNVPPFHAADIRLAAKNSLYLSLAAGVIVALLAFTLSMAFRRRWVLRSDAVGFYLIMLALMTPGYLLAVGTQLFWAKLGQEAGIWRTALGAVVIWGIPFGFLVMVAVWNRYDQRVEEAARDLGADQRRTFREVTLPLVWTGIFGSFLFGFTLAWNDYDRAILFQNASTDTLPLTIGGFTFTGAIRPDLYALGTATTLVSMLAIGLMLVVAGIRSRFFGAPVYSVEEELGLGEGLHVSETSPEKTP
ncbi:MAG TPA: ABC transporter permease subunit [Gaiellaceae bacterium]|nr:ABC transporter permease subunit [Gaiellaceae bacterium]